MKDIFSIESYSYDVPEELIAKFPCENREESRLLIIDKKSGRIDEARVTDLPEFLSASDVLIFNDTKVLHALLIGRLDSNKEIECLLCSQEDRQTWSVMVKGARRLNHGATIIFQKDVVGTVINQSDDGLRSIQFSCELTPELLQKIGKVPLPPYMRRKAIEEIDSQRYQTVYAQHYGAIAAPTAGLHFSEGLLQRLDDAGAKRAHVTLHVGAGTFVPIRVDDIRQHSMHSEVYEVLPSAAKILNDGFPRLRRVAVGTTALRTLETASMADGTIVDGSGSTNLYVSPGYIFKAVDVLFTNFHTPKSSLLVLVATFMGYDLMVEAYSKAIERRFRLFSYGDAMLIV